MNDFSIDKQIIEALNSYKIEKKKEASYKDETVYASRIQEAIEQSDNETVKNLSMKDMQDIIDIINKTNEEISLEKKEIKVTIKDFQELIGTLISEELKKIYGMDNRKIEKTIDLPLGKVTCKVEQVPFYERTPEFMETIINEVIDNERYEWININDEELFKFAEEVKQATGNYPAGIHTKEEISTKITLKK